MHTVSHFHTLRTLSIQPRGGAAYRAYTKKTKMKIQYTCSTHCKLNISAQYTRWNTNWTLASCAEHNTNVVYQDATPLIMYLEILLLQIFIQGHKPFDSTIADSHVTWNIVLCPNPAFCTVCNTKIFKFPTGTCFSTSNFDLIMVLGTNKGSPLSCQRQLTMHMP